jgi:FAD/FMN-containing dehydrogenase
MQFMEDCAVPPKDLPAFVRGVREILSTHETRGVIFGHAGDAHVHANPLIDISRSDWRERIESILSKIVDLTAAFGGTLAAEHGDGRLRAPLLPSIWPAPVPDLFRMIKDAFDPDGILNPGVKVPLPDQTPLGTIKYDPTLAPLPERAQRVLHEVVTKRAYSESRLELLDRL